MEPGFELIPNSDRDIVDPIALVPYNNRWPEQFRLWKERLLAALRPEPQRIEHVGSTAVPGLSAKPIIDIHVTVVDLLHESAYVPAIESLGVQLRSRDDQHRFFRPFAGRLRDVQIHVCSAGSEWERRHLLFRDHLRADAEARAIYLAAKKDAAARWSHDRIAYADANSARSRAQSTRERPPRRLAERSWRPTSGQSGGIVL